MAEISVERLIRRRVPVDASLAALPDDLHPIIKRIYAARGVASDQLSPTLAGLVPVGAFPGAAAVAERLIQAFERTEKILIVGDFDADGATASALCVSCLRALGFADVNYLVPNRVRFGYGLSPAIVDEAAKQEPNLIVTVDNGVSSIAGVARAAELGIDVVVTDHHLPGEALPAAVAIANPCLSNEPFPSKALSGVGVAFYVMAATGRLLAEQGVLDAARVNAIVADHLDLVALGTVADLVPLDFNNRVLVAEGLKRMRGGKVRPGIAALFEVANKNLLSAGAGDLGYGIAPRLNAAGRLDDMSLGIDCLLATDKRDAMRKAARLDALNIERREVQAQMETEARDLVSATLPDLATEHLNAYCLFNEQWHEGVVGLVASRVKDQVRRPVVAFANAEAAGHLKGSARSINGIHIRDVLAVIDARHPGLFGAFGGHAMAAGMTIDAGRLDDFRAAFEQEVSRHDEALTRPDLLWTDGELGAGEFSLEFAEQLRGSGPWGQGFPEPVFENVVEVVDYRVLKDAHLKLTISHPDGSGLTEAIAFNRAELPEDFDGVHLRLVYRLDVNEFRGRRTPQLVVEHLQSA